MTSELDELKDREKLLQQRFRTLQGEISDLRIRLEANNRLMFKLVREFVLDVKKPSPSTMSLYEEKLN